MAATQERLVQTFRRFAVDVDRLESVFRDALRGGFTLDSATPALNRAAAWHCVIELQDCWARFCKEAVLVSARGGVVTRSGRTVPRSRLLGPRDDPEQELQRLWQQSYGHWPRFGPSWEVPVRAIQAAQLLAIGNFAQFSAGIGAQAFAPQELKACRNFLAHRHAGTANHQDILLLRQRVGGSAFGVAPGALSAQFIQGQVTVFEDWCNELIALAGAALQ